MPGHVVVIFYDGDFNRILGLNNIFKNSVIKSKLSCFPWLHIAIIVERWSMIVSAVGNAQFFQMIDWFTF